MCRTLLLTLSKQQQIQQNTQNQIDLLLGKIGGLSELKNTTKDFKGLSPPTFSGFADPNEAESWIISMEKIFRVFKCSETEKVEYAVFQLDKMAYDWWLSTEGLLRGGDDGTPPKSITWNEFKEEFLDKYVTLVLRIGHVRNF